MMVSTCPRLDKESGLSEVARKIKNGVRPHLRALGAGVLALTLASVLFLLLVVVSYAGTFSISAIVGTSATLLTVEGFLLGLSPLIKSKARVLPITLGIFAIVSSLITISLGEALTSIQTLNPVQQYTVRTPFLLGGSMFQYYIITVVMFVFMLEVFWGSALGAQRREWDEVWPD